MRENQLKIDSLKHALINVETQTRASSALLLRTADPLRSMIVILIVKWFQQATDSGSTFRKYRKLKPTGETGQSWAAPSRATNRWGISIRSPSRTCQPFHAAPVPHFSEKKRHTPAHLFLRHAIVSTDVSLYPIERISSDSSYELCPSNPFLSFIAYNRINPNLDVIRRRTRFSQLDSPCGGRPEW